MEKLINNILKDMVEYFKDDVKRINHAIKVFSFASNIAVIENISEEKLLTLRIASILHDIGIKVSEQKYNSSSGKYQQIEGPIVAKEILNNYQIDKDILNRVYYLIGNHHTYHLVDSIDFQILIESDFLVNIFEDQSSIENIKIIYNKYFKTKYGKQLLMNLYIK